MAGNTRCPLSEWAHKSLTLESPRHKPFINTLELYAVSNEIKAGFQITSMVQVVIIVA